MGGGLDDVEGALTMDTEELKKRRGEEGHWLGRKACGWANT